MTSSFLKYAAIHLSFFLFLFVPKLQCICFQEKNELFWVDIDKTLDSKFLVISTASSETSEVLTLDLSSAGEMPSIVAPRRFKVGPSFLVFLQTGRPQHVARS